MALLTPSELDPDQIRQAADRVLAEYAQAGPGLVEQAWRWVLDQIAAIISGLIRAGGGGVGAALLTVVVGGAAVLAWQLLRRVGADRGHRPRPGTIGGRTAQDWRADARRHEEAGAWAAALRSHYRALLADLIATGTIDEIPGRTARGYLHDVVDAAPDAARPMQAVTAAFEAAWYDRREVTRADVQRLRDEAAAVRARLLVAA